MTLLPKRFWLCLLALATLSTAVAATTMRADDDDYDESIRRPIRRLHPEREREKAIKKWEAEQARKQQAEQKAATQASPLSDPWGDASASTAPAAGKEDLYRLLNKDYSIKHYDIPSSPQPMTWRDEPVTSLESDLLPHFARSGHRYTPAGTTMKRTDNQCYFYFDEGGPLHLRVQYYADDPLNYDRMVFTIDGFDYDFTTMARPQRGRDGRMYWEITDDQLTTANRDLVYALSHASWIRLKLLGANGINHVKLLTERQVDDFARAWDLYRLYGGNL